MSSPVAPSSTRFFKLFFMIVLFVLLMLLIAGFGLFYQLERPHAAAPIQTEIHAQMQAIDALSQTVSAQSAQIAALSTDLTAVHQSMHALSQTLQQGEGAWRDTQIQFYITRAAQETFIQKNPQAALSWLKAAQTLIQAQHDPRYIPLQEALKKDQDLLIPYATDVLSEHLIELNALNNMITQLPLLQITTPPASSQTDTSTVTGDTWKDNLKKAWLELKSLIHIRHMKDKEIIPYLTEGQQLLLTENIQLMLEQASLSALRGDQRLYEMHLQQATTWISRYYDRDTPAVQQILSRLQTLQTITVSFTPPSQLYSTQALHEWTQTAETAAP